MSEPVNSEFVETSQITYSGDITQLLKEWSEGKNEAFDKLLPLVYPELRRIAANYLRREQSGNALQPTELIDEAYLRLVGAQSLEWQNRNHFFGIAAKLMRRILVEFAWNHQAAKRGADAKTLSLEEAYYLSDTNDENLLLLNDAMNKLAEIDPPACHLVELRYFVGLTIEETAEVMGLSQTTVKREWMTARLGFISKSSETVKLPKKFFSDS